MSSETLFIGSSLHEIYHRINRREKKTKTKYLAASIVGLLLLSSAGLLVTAGAASWPNVPSTTVQMTVVYGSDSYFDTTLSGVPPGFDVHNGVYAGWCVDRSVTMKRGVSHDVTLYSSISPPVLTGINWVAINYILNHKQGTRLDVQDAIWHFTDNFSPISATAQEMVDAANANPNYDPLTGEILAIICLPHDHPDAQNSIIELTRSTIPGLSPGFWKHNIGVYLELRNGAYSSPYEGFDKSTMPTFLVGLGIDLNEAYTALTTMGGGSAAQGRIDMANALNAAAGFLPYSDE